MMNKVVLKLGRVHRSSVTPEVREFTISIKNSVDNADSYTNNNSETVLGYLEADDLEKKLESIREYLIFGVFDVVFDVEVS